MRRRPFERWVAKPIVFLLALTPALALTVAAVTNRLGANPIESLTHETGTWALRFLLLALAITPLRRLSGWNAPVRFRRMLGLFAFFYVLVHFLVFSVLDHFFAWDDILADIVKRPYITVGFLGLVLLTPLAITSTHGMLRRLGAKRWKTLHRLAYFAAGAGVLHFLWLVKADLREPLIYLSVLTLLLVLRLPMRERRSATTG